MKNNLSAAKDYIAQRPIKSTLMVLALSFNAAGGVDGYEQGKDFIQHVIEQNPSLIKQSPVTATLSSPVFAMFSATESMGSGLEEAPSPSVGQAAYSFATIPGYLLGAASGGLKETAWHLTFE